MAKKGDLVRALREELEAQGLALVNDRTASDVLEGVFRRAGTERCFAKAGPLEPIFTLRAQDLTAPGHVRAWAEEARQRGVGGVKVEEALACADEMEAWGEKHPRKLPD